MIRDFGTVDAGATIEADVCLVGAGAAGITLGLELSGAPLRVVMLEGGGAEESRADRETLEIEVVGLPFTGGTKGRARGLGGTTTLWAGQAMPLESGDFARRSWVPHSGWPIEYESLLPYYRRAESIMGLQNARYDEGAWDELGIDPPDVDSERLRLVFSQYSPEPNFARAFRKELRAASNLDIILNAYVTSVDLDQNGKRVDAVQVRDFAGRSARVRAKAYVLCGGGIEVPRLLLNSRSGAPDGVGNATGLVGRFYQDHANGYTATIHTGSPIYLQERFSLHYRGRRTYFPKLALSMDRQREQTVLNAMCYPVYDFGADSGIEAAKRIYRMMRGKGEVESLGAELSKTLRNTPEVIRQSARYVFQGKSPAPPPESIRLQVHVEQAPSPDSRITLSERRDALGMQIARVDWRLTPQELKTLRVTTEAVASEFERLGLGEVEPEPWLNEEDTELGGILSDSFHHMGATRMAAGPTEGVVDSDCQVFDVEDLYVCSSSVFPTGGYSNPTLTILALAVRLADHLRTGLSSSTPVLG